MSFTINIGSLLRALGSSPTEIRRRIEAHGIGPAPSVKGIQKWRERGAIPSDRLAVLIMLPTFERSPPLDVRKFIERKEAADA